MFLTLVASHIDIGVGLEMFGKEVAEGVVLLLENKVGSVGHAYTVV